MDTTNVPTITRENSFVLYREKENCSPMMRFHKTPTQLLAISAACLHGNTCLLHFHDGDEARTRNFYNYADSFKQPFTWLYFPLSEGETLQQVLVRWTSMTPRPVACLAVRIVWVPLFGLTRIQFTTSLARSYTAGPFIEGPNRDDYNFEPMVNEQCARITALYLNDRFPDNNSVKSTVVAVEIAHKTGAPAERVSQNHWPRAPHARHATIMPNIAVYYTEASLDGLRRIRRRSLPSDQSFCSGLCLETDNGTITIGQWRTNELVIPGVLSAEAGFAFKMVCRNGLGCVSVCAWGTELSDRGWLHAPIGSKLSWWTQIDGDHLQVTAEHSGLALHRMPRQ